MATETLQQSQSNNRTLTSNMAAGGLSYDAEGRITGDGVNTYLYEAQGWLCGVSTTSPTAHYQYVYDAEGRMITTASRSNADCNLGTTTLYDYAVDQFGQQITEVNGAGQWQHTNVFANGELLATYDPNGLHFALSDWLNDKRVQVAPQGATAAISVEHTCWNLAFNDQFGCNGSGNATEHQYTGKERDRFAPSLNHFGARSYTDFSGRFLSPDWSSKPQTVPYADFSNPQSLNLYGYVNNNPLTRVDKDGHDWIYDDLTRNTAQTQNGAFAKTQQQNVEVAQMVVPAPLPLPLPPIPPTLTPDQANTIIDFGSWFFPTLGGVIQDDASAIGNAFANIFSSSNPFIGDPGSVSQTTRPDGSPKQVRRYGPDGYPETDVDHDDHGGQGNPHAHDWGRPSDGGPPKASDKSHPGRPVRPDDPQPQ